MIMDCEKAYASIIMLLHIEQNLRPVSSPAIPLQARLIETEKNCKRRNDYET